MIGWNFPSNGGGETDGANNSAIDAFAGTILSSLVREVIQNSLDASDSDTEPVEVYFDLKSLPADEFDGFSGLIPHIKACREMAQRQRLEQEERFYEHLAEKMQQEKTVNILCIHDANTCGLRGSIDVPEGPWYALTKGAGMSQKTSSSSLGSFGHGSKASFAISDARCVFYYTKITNEKGDQERFQGKSILQSHYWNKDLTQGTGFFGKTKGNLPLLDGKIPDWAAKFRSEKVKGIGTSLYIPYTQYNTGLIPETIITVVANFFFAINSKKLVVFVGDREINHQNLKEVYEKCKRDLPQEQDEIDVGHVESCFKSIDTILNPQECREQQIPDFGRVSWYLRMNDDVDWRAVAIARESGMLITRQPPKLEKFPGLKHFDFFVCVQGKKGSALLKRLENPQHNNFSFDRIRDSEEKKEAKKTYSKFADKIRKIIQSYASTDAEDEESVDELASLFHDFSEEGLPPGSQSERGEKILISDGPISRSRQHYRGGEAKAYEMSGDTFGRGLRGGTAEATTKGGDIPDPEGITPIQDEVPSDEGNLSNERLFVRNLRIRHGKGNKATLYFDSPKAGEYTLVVYKVGENGHEIALLNAGKGKKREGIPIKVKKDKRCSQGLQFTENVSQFALEATLKKKVDHKQD